MGQYNNSTAYKTEIINKINRSINSHKNFNPINVTYSYDKAFKKYCLEHEYTILENSFFTSHIPSNLRSFYLNRGIKTYEIGIVSTKDKAKKILLRRNGGDVKEISPMLSTSTLESIYKAYITDKVSLKNEIKKIKDVYRLMSVLNEYNDILFYYDNNSSHSKYEFYKYEKVSFNFKTKRFKYNIKKYTIGKYTCSLSESNYQEGSITINEAISLLDNLKKMKFIQFSKLDKFLNNHYEDVIKLINENMESSLKLFNEIKTKNNNLN